MSNYVIITDSTTDLPNSFCVDNNVEVISLKYYINEKEYVNYLDERDMTFKAFYDEMRNNANVKTAQINVDEVMNCYKVYLEKGLDIFGIAFSSGLSGTFNSVRLAAEELRIMYPKRKIMIIDSLCASMGEGLYVYYAVKNKNENMSIEENYNKLLDIRMNLCHLFTVDDLSALVKGGRVSKVSGFAAGLLKIKPVLHVDNEGHLIPIDKKIGRKNSLRALVDKMMVKINKSEKQTIFISHADCIDDAKYVMELIKENVEVEVELISYIGPVIGAHAGPGTVALFFLGNER